MTFPVEQKTTKQNVWQMPNSHLCTREDLEKHNGHLLVLVLRKSDTVSVKTVHKESGTILLKRCWLHSQKADVQFSALRAHCLMGQSSSSLVLSVIKTEVLLDSDDPANQDLLLQQYGERIEELSQQDKLSKFCMDAGFLGVVENGRYFMTKDTADLTQFHAVACREQTLPRDEEASQPKGWIQGNTKIGPILEVATSYLHGKYGAEIRIWSWNRDNTHSWVRISHGSNKFAMNLNSNETEIPEDQLE